jgi:pyridinium-3,5-bisthiocarboxylic acid mononucleotide nickel chelatase
MAGGFETDEVYRLETNLDDCAAEVLGSVMDRLFDAGALDVWFQAIQMKKNRPGIMLCALCEEGERDVLADIILTETSAFGVRVERIHRLKLTRRVVKVVTDYGEITVKLGLKGERVVQVAPEYSSAREAAERSGVPLRLAYEAAVRAWEKSAATTE